ncbi:MAG: hypothetical protein ACOH2F_14815 [Cellulomonas sp.]
MGLKAPSRLCAELQIGLLNHYCYNFALGPGDGLEAFEAVYDNEVVSTPSGVPHLTFTRPD